MRVKWTTAALILALAAAGCRNHTDPAPRPGAAAARVEPRCRPGVGTCLGASGHAAQGPSISASTRPGPGGFDANADVDCTFVLEPSSGSTPKFECALADGDQVKVKYGEVIPNGEVPAEIAATRLLAALGFPTDRMNKVKSVRCRGCPPLPQQALQCLDKKQPASVCLAGRRARSDRHVRACGDRAAARGREDRRRQGSGLVVVRARHDRSGNAGGSSRAEVDALRLMAILLAHWDNKGANQKLLCPPAREPA